MAKSLATWGAHHSTLHATGAVVQGAGAVGVKTWAHTEGGACPLLTLYSSETGQLLAIIEAFALGKPVIGARIGGIPELVRHQDTGLLFTSGDAQDLAAQIEALLSRPADAQAMGRRARRLVETELSPERHHAGLMAIYAQASARHGWPADPMRDGRAAPRP